MDMVYFERPALLLFPILLLLWQVFVFLLKKKRRLSSLADTALTGIGLLGHAAAIAVILLNGGKLPDALVLVLVSATLSLALSPEPNGEGEKTEEENR